MLRNQSIFKLHINGRLNSFVHAPWCVSLRAWPTGQVAFSIGFVIVEFIRMRSARHANELISNNNDVACHGGTVFLVHCRLIAHWFIVPGREIPSMLVHIWVVAENFENQAKKDYHLSLLFYCSGFQIVRKSTNYDFIAIPIRVNFAGECINIDQREIKILSKNSSDLTAGLQFRKNKIFQ